MKFPEFHSIRHVSSNEDGMEELAIERDQTFVEWIIAMFSARKLLVKTTVTDTYVNVHESWINKDTGFCPDDNDQIILFILRDTTLGLHVRQQYR